MSTWQPVMEQLVVQRYGALVGRARLLLGATADAEDLVQDALVATFSAGVRLASVVEAERYVRTAIATRSVDRARSRARERRTTTRWVGGVTDQMPDPADELGGPVLAALAELGPRHRACVVLRHLDDLSVAQTARALGLSEGAVKRYTFEAVAALNQRLGTVASDVESVEVLTTQEVRRDA